MFQPSLHFMRRVLSPDITECRVELLKVSASPSRVYRVYLQTEGESGISSVIVKVVAPKWPNDERGHDRELLTYTRLLPQMTLRTGRVYHAKAERAGGYRVIVLEDLATSLKFQPSSRAWSSEEAGCMARTYARLHVEGQACLPSEEDREWLFDRYDAHLHDTDMVSLAEDLVRWEVWAPLQRLDRLWEQTVATKRALAHHPLTLLHNDVTPSNIGLPTDLTGEGALVDWEMTGYGLAELDLAYMFTQPFGSERQLERPRVLDAYWAQRKSLEGRIPSRDERDLRQRYADAVLALWLIPVAHRVAVTPYRESQAPAVYWRSMFQVLEERLRQLCEEL